MRLFLVVIILFKAVVHSWHKYSTIGIRTQSCVKLEGFESYNRILSFRIYIIMTYLYQQYKK